MEDTRTFGQSPMTPPPPPLSPPPPPPPLPPPSPSPQPTAEPFDAFRPTLCEDGVYRWMYEVNLFTNPSMFYDLMLALGISFGVLAVVMVAGLLYNGMIDDMDAWVNIAIGFGGVVAFMFLISVISYLIWATGKGGKYVAVFEMGETSVTHKQMEKDVKKTQAISAIGVLTGVLTANPTIATSAFVAGCVNSWTSDYRSVRKVKMRRRRHLIKVNELFTQNRVYVKNKEDYDFVYNYITSRCPRLKKV